MSFVKRCCFFNCVLVSEGHLLEVLLYNSIDLMVKMIFIPFVEFMFYLAF